MMIIKEEKLKCDCCSKEFFSEYYHGGSIEHNNYTDDYNMHNAVKKIEEDKEYKRKFFLDSIALSGNPSNIKDNTYEVGYDIYKCRILWLQKNGYNEIAEWLESQEKFIIPEFEKVLLQQINEKKKEIAFLEGKLHKLIRMEVRQ